MKKLKNSLVRLTSSDRLYEISKPIIALTGGIATGKSSVSKILKDRGLKVIDADQLVKAIYETSKAKEFIKINFPQVWINEGINFKQLRELFFFNISTKEKVENFIYPMLHQAFIKEVSDVRDQDFIIYDVPLLFEKKLETKVDQVVVVYAPENLQKKRIVKRDGTAQEVIEAIIGQQIDIEVKKTKADFIINNAGEAFELSQEVEDFLRKILIK